MPRPAPPTRERLPEFNDSNMLQMFVGWDYFHDSYGENEQFNEALAAHHWALHRDWIIESYLVWNRDGKRDQTMPWAFYRFEAS
jgi:hypothetical protein